MIQYTLYLNSIGKVPTEAQSIFLSYTIDNLLKIKDFDFLPSDFFGNFFISSLKTNCFICFIE